MATDKDIDSAGAPADDWLCLPLPVLHLDPGGHVRRVNRAASTLLGLTQPLSSNQGIDDFLGLAGRVVFHEHLVPRVRLERELRDVRLPLQLPDGRELSMRAQAGWRRDPQGVESIWLALTADHDPSRRDAELTRVRRAADCSPAMLFEYIVERDGRGRFSYASNALLALFGLVPEQVRDDDQALLDRLHPDDRARWIATRDEAAAQDHVWVLICRTADTAPGPARHVGWRARPQRGEGGATIWHGVVGDVTRLETERLAREQRMADAETARQAMQEMAEDLLDAQPTLLSFWDDGLRLRFANEAFLSLLAVPREQALGRTLHELIGSMPGQRDWPDLGRVLAGETIETQVSGTGGRSHRHWMHAAPSRRHGEIDGCLLVATDISAVVEARQRAENLNAALARTEHFLRLIADSLPARVAYFDRDRICRFANRQYGEWLQRPIDEVIGKTAETLLSPKHAPVLMPRITAALAGEPQSLEREEQGPDGASTFRHSHYFPDRRHGRVHGVVVLSTDVTPIKQAQCQLRELNEQLIVARDRAESGARAKSSFLANMSHEIRTPMNAIVGLAHVMARDARDTVQRERLGKIDAACHLLLQIINDVLDLSKIEAGAMVLETVEFSLDEVAARAFDLVGERAREKGLELVIDIGDVPDQLTGDPTRLLQAVVNLLSNAVKFTERGWVRLRVETPRDEPAAMLRFSVTDTGPGIAADRQLQIFDAFEQADASITRRHHGTGLGLAITRHLARLMGGDVGLTSAPGEGSTFWFSARLERGRPAIETHAAVPLQGLRVLLVDDLPESLSPIEERLRGFGLEVETVTSGPAAIDRTRRHMADGRPYDLMLIDWQMQPLDGGQTLRALRDVLGAGLPPSVLITAFDEPAVRQASLAAGFSECLVKPITPSALLDTLNRALRGRPAQAVPQEPGAGVEEERLRRQHAGQRVLLAEDNPINQEVAVELLRSAGLVVDTAIDGQQAVELASDRAYGLVLMDVQMPRMDGMSAARELRRRGRTSLPIIAMTAHAFAEDRAACLAAGMNDHLAKPVDPRTLYALLLRWLPAPAPALAAGLSDEGRRAPLMQRLAQVEGLKPTVGLRSLGGNEVLLERILWRFVQLYRAGCPALRDAGLDRPDSRSQESAHSVCGACYTIGAVGLGDQLRALENALREGGHDPALLTMEGGRLEEELIKLADDLQEALGCEETAAAATPPSDAAGRRAGAASAV